MNFETHIDRLLKHLSLSSSDLFSNGRQLVPTQIYDVYTIAIVFSNITGDVKDAEATAIEMIDGNLSYNKNKGGANLESENHDEMNLYAITFRSRKGATIIRNSDDTARADGTTARDTRSDQISIAIDEEVAIADDELTLKCCGGKRLIKSGHDKFFVRKAKKRPYQLVHTCIYEIQGRLSYTMSSMQESV